MPRSRAGTATDFVGVIDRRHRRSPTAGSSRASRLATSSTGDLRAATCRRPAAGASHSPAVRRHRMNRGSTSRSASARTMDPASMTDRATLRCAASTSYPVPAVVSYDAATRHRGARPVGSSRPSTVSSTRRASPAAGTARGATSGSRSLADTVQLRSRRPVDTGAVHHGASTPAPGAEAPAATTRRQRHVQRAGAGRRRWRRASGSVASWARTRGAASCGYDEHDADRHGQPKEPLAYRRATA